MRTDTTISRRLTRRTRPTAAFAAGLVLMAVAGCGSSGSSEESSEDPTAAATPSESPSGSPSTPSDEDLAKVVAGAPKDLTWGIGQVPSSWKQMVKKPGEVQWGVREKCLVTLQQPGGLGQEEPTQDQVVRDGVAFIERGSKVDLTLGKIVRQQFPVRSNLENTAMTTAVSVGDFTGPRGVQGQVYAHRAGEFALIVMTVCAEDKFAAVDRSDLRPFVEELVVQATY